MYLYKVTFTNGPWLVCVCYNESDTEDEAIASAKCHVVNDYTKVRAEAVRRAN